MMRYLLITTMVGVLTSVVGTKTSPTEVTRDIDSCKLPLPVGCSCVHDRTAVSVECSGAQMTSVPKHWFGSGNLVVKTLNLERNNISEVYNWKLMERWSRLVAHAGSVGRRGWNV